jgi:hypothetical protein
MEAALLPMDELAMNFSPERVHHGDFKVLIVAEAAIANMLCKLFAMDDRFGIALKLNADPIPHRNAVFHIKEKCLHGGQSSRV